MELIPKYNNKENREDKEYQRIKKQSRDEFIKEQKEELIKQRKIKVVKDILNPFKEKEKINKEVKDLINSFPMDIKAFKKLVSENELIRNEFQHISKLSLKYTKKFINKEIFDSNIDYNGKAKSTNPFRKTLFQLRLTIYAEVLKFNSYLPDSILEKDHKFAVKSELDAEALKILESIFFLIYLDKNVKTDSSLLRTNRKISNKDSPKAIIYRNVLEDINSFEKDKGFRHEIGFRESAANLLAKDFLIENGKYID